MIGQPQSSGSTKSRSMEYSPSMRVSVEVTITMLGCKESSVTVAKLVATAVTAKND